MHLEDKIYNGIVDEYDLDHNFAVVIIIASLDVNVALKHVVEILPHGEVLALGRAISGKPKATNVILAGDSSGYEDEDPTCKISEVHLCYDASILVCFCYYIRKPVPRTCSMQHMLFNCNPCTPFYSC